MIKYFSLIPEMLCEPCWQSMCDNNRDEGNRSADLILMIVAWCNPNNALDLNEVSLQKKDARRLRTAAWDTRLTGMNRFGAQISILTMASTFPNVARKANRSARVRLLWSSKSIKFYCHNTYVLRHLQLCHPTQDRLEGAISTMLTAPISSKQHYKALHEQVLTISSHLRTYICLR